ncbi:hypothetical protein TOPH_00805 [Tolypocladium ophioglossoides CBS 100239]|uniref:F-box domain-containing protein n=1 Tax=Tolypocladium ophioglossoides (strain CBS 100239) TaxID=1163406 RepID=A0A0L0NJE5_TOLOC|nr:hypothetical protein TOPH_00805 [Tolypocladium ophioglossoides CBS 100239]
MDAPASPNSGNPNPQYRTAAIDAFLAGLSPWELIYLRSHFRDGRPKVGGLASFEDLPAELVCITATEHLRLEDVLNCRRVSRAWRAAWDCEAVCSALCRYFFPGLVEIHAEDQEQASARDLFLQEAEQFLRRRHGNPLQKSFIVWDDAWSSEVFRNNRPEGDDEDAPQSNILAPPQSHQSLPVVYGDGKVAWRPSNTRIIIDDLRTRQRQICSFSQFYLSGLILNLESVTKDLLVLVAKGGNTVHVWHLNLEEWRRITLPARFSACYAEAERAVFVTAESHVVSWNWGGKALDLGAKEEANLGVLKNSWSHNPPSIIWHPIRRSTLFISFVYHHIGAHICNREVHVLKYEDGKPVKRFTEIITCFAETDLSLTNMSVWLTSTRCQKMNSHGLYLMATVCLEYPPTSTFSSEIRNCRPVAVASVAFNVLTEAFVQRHYLNANGNPTEHFHRSEEVAMAVLSDNWRSAWGDQLILIGQRRCDPCTRWFQVDYHSSQAESSGPGPDISERQSEVNHYIDPSERGDVFCDSGFMVFTTTIGMLVWAFCDVPELPVLQSSATCP